MTTPADPAATGLTEQLANGSLAGAWKLDPARSTATLKSRSMWGLVPVKGTFREIEGEATVSPAGEVTGSLELRTASLDTKIAKRDEHLRSDDILPGTLVRPSEEEGPCPVADAPASIAVWQEEGSVCT